MCCHIDARSNQMMDATREDQGINMSGQQGWLQKPAFSGHFLVGLTHKQGEKLNHNTEFLTVVREEAGVQVSVGRMLFSDTNKWSYSKKEQKDAMLFKELSNDTEKKKKVQESIVKRTRFRVKMPKVRSPRCQLTAVKPWDCFSAVSQYPHLWGGDSYSISFIGCCQM